MFGFTSIFLGAKVFKIEITVVLLEGLHGVSSFGTVRRSYFFSIFFNQYVNQCLIILTSIKHTIEIIIEGFVILDSSHLKRAIFLL